MICTLNKFNKTKKLKIRTEIKFNEFISTNETCGLYNILKIPACANFLSALDLVCLATHIVINITFTKT